MTPARTANAAKAMAEPVDPAKLDHNEQQAEDGEEDDDPEFEAELPATIMLGKRREMATSIFGVVTGQVLSGEEPVCGAVVACGHRSAVSDRDGHFALIGLADGTHRLRVRAAGYEEMTAPVNVRSSAVTDAGGVELRRE